MMVASDTTQFASAQRTPPDQLQKQIRMFEGQIVASLMLNAVPDIFIVLNENRQVVYANTSLRHQLGVQSNVKIYGKRPGEMLNCVHASETDGGCGTTTFCTQCGAIKAILTSLGGEADVQECRITVKGGDAMDLRVSTKPLVINEERFVMFAVQDISHEKRRQILEQVFFHDILNSAGFIAGVMDLVAMTEDEGDPVDLNDYRQDLDVYAQRIVNEIKSQRMLLAAEEGNLQLSITEFNVKHYLEQTVWAIRRNARAKQLDLRLQADDEVSMQTDPTLLGRVLINMVKNALEASAPGNTVSLSYRVDDEKITFVVHNETYMSRKVQLQVFNRSFSTKGSGRGLGTYSMKLFTEQYLGGEIGFTTSKTQGTTFFATFPLSLE